MMQQRLQASRVIEVYPNDLVGIPDPSSRVVAGTTTSANTNELIDSSANFTGSGIERDHIVYNTTSKLSAKVVSIDSDTVITLSANIFSAGSQNYAVYGRQTDGATFYVGVAGNMSVVTSGKDSVVIPEAPNGYHPIHIVQVKSTGTLATDILALF